MSELILYIVATGVVLAGVVYFFLKQREQEALTNRSSGRSKQPKAKKEPKVKKETKEREARPRKVKEEVAPAPLSKRQKANAAKEEDETKGVIDFLKGKKFTSEQTEKSVQAKVRSAPPQQQQKATAAAPVKRVVSDSESDSDNEGNTDYVTIKRKIKSASTKDKTEETPETTNQPTQSKKNKFFTKDERDAHNAKRDAEKAEREAYKKLTPAEKNKLRKEKQAKERAAAAAAGDDGDFQVVKGSRKDRAPRGEGEDSDESSEQEEKKKYPPKKPEQAPVFAEEYQAKEMDHILNSMTQFYAANPNAGRTKKSKKPEGNGKAAEDDQ